MREVVGIVGFVLLAAGLILVASTGFQAAPTSDSVKVFQRTPASPAWTQTFASLRSDSFTPTWTDNATFRYSGVSLLIYTAIRTTSTYWTLFFQIQCGGQTVVASGTSNVHAYVGSPGATAWTTLAVQNVTGLITKGQSCSLSISRQGGEAGSSLYWVSEASNPNAHGLVVWGQPPSAPLPPPSPPGVTPTSTTTTTTTPTPPPPAGPDLGRYALWAVIIILIVFGAVFLTSALVELLGG